MKEMRKTRFLTAVIFSLLLLASKGAAAQNYFWENPVRVSQSGVCFPSAVSNGQIAVGGKAAVVLSSADEASYNQAIQELRNNNVIGAYTIVEQLLQTPANRRSSKILDLQKQVQARM